MYFLFISHHISSDGSDGCYEFGSEQNWFSCEDEKSCQSPMTSPRPGQRNKRERTFSLSKSVRTGTKTDAVLRTRQRTIYTAGRPPWYDAHGQLIEPFVVGKNNLFFNGKF